MQWCVQIAGGADLEGDLTLAHLSSLESSSKLQPAVRLTAALIARYFGDVQFTRCAFGTEFCEHLLPSPEALGAAVDATSPLAPIPASVSPRCSG